MSEPFALPAYLEPYRSCVWIDNGQSIEAVVNSGTKHTSFDDAVRQVSVLHQLKLLRALMTAGLLLVAVPVPPKRPPSKATKAKRAKRRR